MARPRKPTDEKRRKWPVLNVTPAERTAITAAALEAGLGINDYILACTRQTRLVRRSDREDMVRLLAGAEARLDEIARAALAAPLATADIVQLLLALREVETALGAGDHLAGNTDDPDDADRPEC